MEEIDEEESAFDAAINSRRPEDVQEAFMTLPGTLSRWGERYAEALSAAAAYKESLEDREAEVYLELRAEKEKGQTEGTLKAAVRLDKRVRIAAGLHAQAEAKKVRLYHKIMQPLYARRDMLQSLGAHQREELRGDPLVKRANLEDLERRAFGPTGNQQTNAGDDE